LITLNTTEHAMNSEQLVSEQYEVDSLQARVESALHQAGLGDGKLNWADLVPLDQFHVRGLAATRELAEALSIKEGSKLLDIGCGIGGPARFLAATCECNVTGIDLSQSFVDVAATLTRRCGLEERVTVGRADALKLPFAQASFDDAWTQHVAMNIADRTMFYAEIHRVLKPGGRLAIYDVIAGDGRSLIFPVPWARRPEMSFLLTADEMRAVLGRTGFVDVSSTDKTEVSLNWFAELQTRPQPSSPLGIPVVMGQEFPLMVENLRRNLQEGRVGLIQAIYSKAEEAPCQRAH
jgi:SAM-dependent methyltransferase